MQQDSVVARPIRLVTPPVQSAPRSGPGDKHPHCSTSVPGATRASEGSTAGSALPCRREKVFSTLEKAIRTTTAVPYSLNT